MLKCENCGWSGDISECEKIIHRNCSLIFCPKCDSRLETEETRITADMRDYWANQEAGSAHM